MKAYKLFRLRKDGSLGSLFINRKQVIDVGVWYEAEDHPTKGFAHRPYFHMCSQPIAPHLSMELKSGEQRIWAECEMEDYEVFDRPATQGGIWYLAGKIKVVKLLPEITNTTGE